MPHTLQISAAVHCMDSHMYYTNSALSADLEEEQKNDVVHVMSKRSGVPGEVLIRQARLLPSLPSMLEPCQVQVYALAGMLQHVADDLEHLITHTQSFCHCDACLLHISSKFAHPACSCQ